MVVIIVLIILFSNIIEGVGGEVSDAFSDYTGQFFLRKLPRLNSIVSFNPETLNYVFKVGRRKFHIEILHLGPEESRSTKERTKKAIDEQQQERDQEREREEHKLLDSHSLRNKSNSSSNSGKGENKNITSMLCSPGLPSNPKVLDF